MSEGTPSLRLSSIKSNTSHSRLGTITAISGNPLRHHCFLSRVMYQNLFPPPIRTPDRDEQNINHLIVSQFTSRSCSTASRGDFDFAFPSENSLTWLALKRTIVVMIIVYVYVCVRIYHVGYSSRLYISSRSQHTWVKTSLVWPRCITRAFRYIS